MAQFSTRRNNYLVQNDEIFEVVMIAGQSGPSVYVDLGNLNTSADAFGRLRVSSPYTLFDSHNLLNENSRFDESVAGSGSSTHVVNTSSVDMTVTDADGDEVVRQSYRHFSYQPGKSLLTMSTMVMSQPKENLRQRVGYFNTQNGVFLEQDGDTLYIVMRSYVTGSAVDTRIAQSDWSVDTLDGNGKSAVTLDVTKSHIFWTDFEWLGVGSVRVGFVINGQFICAHIFHNANKNNNVYITTPNLPIRYEITNTGATSGSSTMKQICSTVLSEGGYEARAVDNIVGTASLGGVTVNTDYVNLATIRLKQSGAIVVPSGADVLNVSNSDFEWALFKNATPTTAFSWTTATNNVEYSLQTTTFTDTGKRVAGGYMGGKTSPFTLGDGGLSWDNQLGQLINGTSDTLTLAVRAGSNSKTAAGLIKWYEL